MGANTATIPTVHAADFNRYEAVEFVRPTAAACSGVNVSLRTAEMATESGWLLAQPCSHVGIEATGTKALEANTSGAMIGNAAACVVSALAVDRPMRAKIHDSANPSISRTTIATENRKKPAWIRYPTMKPTVTIR